MDLINKMWHQILFDLSEKKNVICISKVGLRPHSYSFSPRCMPKGGRAWAIGFLEKGLKMGRI